MTVDARVEDQMAPDSIWGGLRIFANVVGVVCSLVALALFGYFASLIIPILRYI
jgi:hypothetical protein